MPFANQIAARLKDPARYKTFRRTNDKFGPGISAIWGVLPDGKVELHTIRFDSSKFNADEAHKWLDDHGYKPILFEPAVNKKESVEDGDDILEASTINEGDLIKMEESTTPTAPAVPAAPAASDPAPESIKESFKEAHSVSITKPLGKEWEVVLIESGKSINGNFYPAEVLKKAVPLFEGLRACAYRFGENVQKFDHLPENVIKLKNGLSANVVGWFESVHFADFVRPDGTKGEGIVGKFHLLEGAEWLRDNLKDAWDHGKKDLLGFSIDADGKARRMVVAGLPVRYVDEIDTVSSTDIVSEPSAGGKLLRLVASCSAPSGSGVPDPKTIELKENQMDKAKILEMLGASGLDPAVQKELADKLCGMTGMTEAMVNYAITEAKGKCASETKMKESSEAIKKQEAALKVKSAIIESGLPKLSQARVEKILLAESKSADEDIKKAIDDEKAFIASFTESKGTTVAVPPAPATDVKVTQEQYDKVRKGFEGFFNMGIPVDGVPAFTSLHEAFGRVAKPKRFMNREEMSRLILESIALGFSGSQDQNMDDYMSRFTESFNGRASTRLREAIVTSDFTRAFGDAMNVRLQKEYASVDLNSWRSIVSTIGSLNDLTNPVYVSRIGGYSVYPTVNQNAPYQEQTDPTEKAETLTPAKKGGLHKLTWEDVLADRIGYIRSIPKQIGRAAARTVNRAVWGLIEANTVLSSDSLALIENGTHKNLLADSALSYDNVMALQLLLENQTEQDNAEKLGLMGKFLLCGPEKRQIANEITKSDYKREINVATAAANQNQMIANVVKSLGIESLVSTELGRSVGTKYRYHLMVSPNDAETIEIDFLGGRDRPDIFVQSPTDTPVSGDAFSADALTFKVRFGFGAALVDYRWIAGCLATS